MQAISRVTCSDFDNEWINEKDTFCIENQAQIAKISECLSRTTPISNSQNEIDTKARMIIIYESGRKDYICFNATNVFMVNGKLMQSKDDELVDLVDNMRKIK